MWRKKQAWSLNSTLSKLVKRLEMGKTEGGGWYSQVGQGGVENLNMKKWKTRA